MKRSVGEGRGQKSVGWWGVSVAVLWSKDQGFLYRADLVGGISKV